MNQRAQVTNNRATHDRATNNPLGVDAVTEAAPSVRRKMVGLLIGEESVIGESSPLKGRAKQEDIDCMYVSTLNDIVHGFEKWGAAKENRYKTIVMIVITAHGPIWVRNEKKKIIEIQEPFIYLGQIYRRSDFESSLLTKRKQLKRQIWPLTRKVEELEINICNLGNDHQYYKRFREAVCKFLFGPPEDDSKIVKVTSYNAYKDLYSNKHVRDPSEVEGIGIGEKAQVKQLEVVVEYYNRFIKELTPVPHP